MTKLGVHSAPVDESLLRADVPRHAFTNSHRPLPMDAVYRPQNDQDQPPERTLPPPD